MRDVKGHPVAVVQRLEAGSIDAGVMDEYILTIFRLDETVTLFVAEPLDSSIGHRDTLLSKSSHGPIRKGATLIWTFPSNETGPLNWRTFHDYYYDSPFAENIK
jgi:hypothetical protein